jgi:hypothetical protein
MIVAVGGGVLEGTAVGAGISVDLFPPQAVTSAKRRVAKRICFTRTEFLQNQKFQNYNGKKQVTLEA